MSRVITFSRHFPKGHPRQGEPTFFAEQILKGLSIPDYWSWFDEANINCGADHHDFIRKFNYIEFNIKSHTIRAGNRWKVGDKFSLRVWSGKPYASKQIIIAPDMEIKKIYSIKIEGFHVHINKELFSQFEFTNQIAGLAKNDGLDTPDFWGWFPCKAGKIFEGQILCWNEKITYD